MSKTGGGKVPQNPTNRGIMDQIRALKVGGFFLAAKTQRPRFYGDFKRLGWTCSTRIVPRDPTKIRVYRLT